MNNYVLICVEISIMIQTQSAQAAYCCYGYLLGARCFWASVYNFQVK